MTHYSLSASSANITWWGTCSVCGQTLSQCRCNGSGIWVNPTPYPLNPGTSPTTCQSCGQHVLMCQCHKLTINPNHSHTWTTTTTSISGWASPISLLSGFVLADVLTSEQIKDHDHVLSVRKRDETGFMGTLTYLSLPLMFSNYFLHLGQDEQNVNIWTLLSPLLFKFSLTEDEKLTEHLVTVLGIGNLSKDVATVRLENVKLVEIVDNFAFFQLAERDKAFRKRLNGEN